MDSFCVCAILLTFAVTVTGQFTCPDDGQGGCTDGFYPVIGDCTTYYECISCSSIVRYCPPDTHYDRYEQTCQDPVDARCDWSSITGTLFSVARQTGTYEGPMYVTYPVVIVNDQNPFDTVSSSVMTGTAGTYFFHLSAGTRPGNTVDIQLEGLPYNAGVYSNNPLHNIDVQSRDMMASLSRGVQLRVALKDSTWIVADASRSNLWTGFCLEDYMNNVVAFSSSRAQSITTSGVVVFDEERVDTANSYDENTGEFTAPIAGTYLFTFSGLVAADANFEAYFDSSISGYDSLILRTVRTTSNVVDTISKSILVKLELGEKYRINVDSGRAEGGVDNSLTFSGFLYQPLPSTSAQAWSVYRTNASDPVDTLAFDVVDINDGLLYNTMTHHVEVDVSGYYYMTVNVGTRTNTPVDTGLVHTANGFDELLFSIYRSSDTGYLFDGDTMTKSIVAHLNRGDKVRVGVNSASGIFSTATKLTSFSGFLLQETSVIMQV